MRCGACGHLIERGQRVLHHRFGDGSILCSTTAKRTFMYADNEIRPEARDTRGDSHDGTTEQT